jgi:NADPH:quinone reductase-like Zn-dependent oxidoreductase
VPGDDEVLVKVHATTVNRTDCGWRSAKPFIVRYFIGLRRPRRRILGMELAGEVEAVGPAVSSFEVGDEVFGVKGFGAHAELTSVRESAALALKPADMTFEEAAAVPSGAITALSFIRKANVRTGQKVLVYGASGSVGTYAVQLARHFGAEVTGVCSTANLEMLKSLGADKVIDYMKEDIAGSGEAYDLVFDAVGKSARSRWKGSLNEGGAYISVMSSASLEAGDLAFLKELIEAGKLWPVIDRRYPLEQIVEAHCYVEKGHKMGNVVITVAQDR